MLFNKKITETDISSKDYPTGKLHFIIIILKILFKIYRDIINYRKKKSLLILSKNEKT